MSGPIPDEPIERLFPRSPAIEMTGRAGTMFAIDATNCLHFGGRCFEGDRIVTVFTYASFHSWHDADNIAPALEAYAPRSEWERLAVARSAASGAHPPAGGVSS